MQAVYFPPNKVDLNRGEMFKLNCCHDEYSVWFSFGAAEYIIQFSMSIFCSTVPRPYCNCRFHTIYSRQSIYSLNSMINNKTFANFGEKVRVSKKIYQHFQTFKNEFIVVLGEGSLFGLSMARFASKVVIIDINGHSREILTK